MRLLKKDTPFVCDDLAQCVFDILKQSITHAPVSQPFDYTKDYSFYVVVSFTTIYMVLVQIDVQDQEYVIYYLSKSLPNSKTYYSHVKKLALAMVIVVQKFHHYIFLCTTTIYADSNPMYYILNLQVGGGKYSC